MFGMFNKKSAALESQLNEAKQQKETVNQALADLQVKFDAQASDLAAAHAETAKAKQDGDAAINAAKEEAQAKTTLLAEVQAQLSEKIESERSVGTASADHIRAALGHPPDLLEKVYSEPS